MYSKMEELLSKLLVWKGEVLSWDNQDEAELERSTIRFIENLMADLPYQEVVNRIWDLADYGSRTAQELMKGEA
jgi:hypothetical protein